MLGLLDERISYSSWNVRRYQYFHLSTDMYIGSKPYHHLLLIVSHKILRSLRGMTDAEVPKIAVWVWPSITQNEYQVLKDRFYTFRELIIPFPYIRPLSTLCLRLTTVSQKRTSQCVIRNRTPGSILRSLYDFAQGTPKTTYRSSSLLSRQYIPYKTRPSCFRFVITLPWALQPESIDRRSAGMKQALKLCKRYGRCSSKLQSVALRGLKVEHSPRSMANIYPFSISHSCREGLFPVCASAGTLFGHLPRFALNDSRSQCQMSMGKKRIKKLLNDWRLCQCAAQRSTFWGLICYSESSNVLME